MTQQNRPPYAKAPFRGGRDTGPSYAQLLEEVRSAGMIETMTTVEVTPVAANEYLCIVRAECIMPALQENRPMRRFVGLGAAYPKKAGDGVVHGVSNPIYFIHIAETRAKKRAWQDALGRGDGLEEDVRGEVMAERGARAQMAKTQSVTMSSAALPSVATVVVPAAFISEEIAQKLAQATNVPIEMVRQYTRDQALEIWNNHKRQLKSAESN